MPCHTAPSFLLIDSSIPIPPPQSFSSSFSILSVSCLFPLSSLFNSSLSLFCLFSHFLLTSLISLHCPCSPIPQKVACTCAYACVERWREGGRPALQRTTKAEDCLPLFLRADPLPGPQGAHTVPHLSQGGTCQEQSQKNWASGSFGEEFVMRS